MHGLQLGKAGKARKPKRQRLVEFQPTVPPGEVPGEAVADQLPPLITVFSYGRDECEEKLCETVDQALSMVREDRVTWINVDGMGDLHVLRRLWDRFGVHPLIQEDVVNVQQRPKFEEYDDQLFLVMRMVQLRERLESEQVSVVFGKGWLLSFQETRGDVFDPIRERLRKGRLRIRAGGPDYLAYSLLDAAVDGFFPILEKYGAALEEIEQQTIENPQEGMIQIIHDLRRDFMVLRRSLAPLREAVVAMQRAEGSPLIKKETRVFLRDASDHVIRVLDELDSYNELSKSLLDIYFSTLSTRMTSVMKVLTIVTSIFIPLTFIAGVYGMNFAYMPELEWHYGYFVVLGSMIALALGMVVMFRKRDWL